MHIGPVTLLHRLAACWMCEEEKEEEVGDASSSAASWAMYALAYRFRRRIVASDDSGTRGPGLGSWLTLQVLLVGAGVITCLDTLEAPAVVVVVGAALRSGCALLRRRHILPSLADLLRGCRGVVARADAGVRVFRDEQFLVVAAHCAGAARDLAGLGAA